MKVKLNAAWFVFGLAAVLNFAAAAEPEVKVVTLGTLRPLGIGLGPRTTISLDQATGLGWVEYYTTIYATHEGITGSFEGPNEVPFLSPGPYLSGSEICAKYLIQPYAKNDYQVKADDIRLPTVDELQGFFRDSGNEVTGEVSGMTPIWTSEEDRTVSPKRQWAVYPNGEKVSLRRRKEKANVLCVLEMAR
jgi:hypothetical protein